MSRRPSYASVAAGGGRSNLSARVGMLAHGSATGSNSYSSGDPLSPSLDGPNGADETASQLPQSNNPEHPIVRLGHMQQPVQTSGGGGHEASSAAVEGPTPGPTQQHHHFAAAWEYEMEREENLSLYGRHTTTGPGNERFLMPGYLHGSRYMRKLVDRRNAKEAARREVEAANGHHGHRPSRSSSTTNLGTQKIVPSHRGMTYEVIEARVPEDDLECSPLPSRWTEGELETFAEGAGLKWPAAGHGQEFLSAQTDFFMPRECGMYYFEVRIEQLLKGSMVAVGVSGGKHDLKKLPGWEAQSWAWHGDDGKKFACANIGTPYDKSFGKGDTIGCGINFWTGTVFFTRNGHRLEDAFRDLSDQKLCPTVGMRTTGGAVLVNFGQEPFKYNVADEVKREKAKLKAAIDSTPLSRVLSGRTEDNFVKELVAQFLRHGGYVETAKAFTSEVQTEHQALGTETTISGNAAIDDIDAAQRQRIRSAILAGDVDRAIKCTQDFYPEVLDSNPIIHFRLKAMKFLEIVRLVTNAGRPDPVPVSPLKKEKAKATLPGGTATNSMAGAMELDEEPADVSTLATTAAVTSSINWPRETSGGDDHIEALNGNVGKLPTAATLSLTGNPMIDLQTAILEGQRLSEEYDKNQRREIREIMRHVKGIWAYEDPASSKEVGYLFRQEERVKVAEELNGAILVSMGKSSVAAIERMAQQTEVLVEEITEHGQPGAFINLERDML